MKIFVDGLIFAKQCTGGISRMWFELLKRLPNFDMDIILFVPLFHNNVWLKKIIRERMIIKRKRDLFFWPESVFQRDSVRSRALQFHMENSVDIFQSTFFSTVYRKKVKKVVTVHDMILEKFPGLAGNYLQRLEMDKKKAAVQNADRVVAVSQNTKRDLIEIYPWISEEKIQVIYHGPFRVEKEVPLDAISRKYGCHLLPQNYFLYVGGRKNYKNFQILMSLVERKKQYRDSMFCCVGGGRFDRTYKRLAEKGLERNFKFVPSVSDDELAALYKNAKALLFTSKYEGFGLPVLEAMANECPVICGNVSSLPEIAKDAAFYFDPCSIESLDEAIGRLNCADRIDIVKHGKETASDFSWERSADEIKEVYLGLL